VPLTTVISHIVQKETSRVEMQVQARKGSVMLAPSRSLAYHVLSMVRSALRLKLPPTPWRIILSGYHLLRGSQSSFYTSLMRLNATKSTASRVGQQALASSEHAHPFDEKRPRSHVASDLSSLYHAFWSRGCTPASTAD
jgi:hypothetical protein